MVTHVVFSSVPAQFVEELEKVIALIRDIQDELQSPILHGQQYEDFSRQEDKLKVSTIPLVFCHVTTEARNSKIIKGYMLRNSEPHPARQGEDFSRQEDKLKVSTMQRIWVSTGRFEHEVDNGEGGACQQRQSPMLHGQQYEDFSRQEDKLKVKNIPFFSVTCSVSTLLVEEKSEGTFGPQTAETHPAWAAVGLLQCSYAMLFLWFCFFL